METLLKELCQEKKFEKAKNKIKNLLSRIKWFKVAASAISLGASITASVATGNPLPIVMSVPRTAEGAANAIKEISDNAEDTSVLQEAADSFLYPLMKVQEYKWEVPEIQKWLDCEPKELYEQRLNKYFYLTRENLAKNIIDQQNFSEEAKRIHSIFLLSRSIYQIQ